MTRHSSRRGKKQATLDEIVGHILAHGGPDRRRRAHPQRRVQYADLIEALRHVRMEDPSLAHLLPHHFAEVIGIWKDEPYHHARPMTGELVAALQDRRGWSLAEVVENIEARHFKEEPLFIRVRGRPVRYTARPALHVYEESPSAALLDWLAHHPDRRIRRGYAKVRPWHFKKVPRHALTRNANEGARALTGDVMAAVRAKYGWSAVEALQRVHRGHYCRDPLLLRTPSGPIRYCARPALRVYGHSTYDAFREWLICHPDEKYRNTEYWFKPWHTSKAGKGTWQGRMGRSNACVVVSELIFTAMRRYGWSMEETFANLTARHFTHEPLETHTPLGVFRYRAGSVLTHGSRNSPRRALDNYRRGGLR